MKRTFGIICALVFLEGCMMQPQLPDALVFKGCAKQPVKAAGIRRLAVMEFQNHTGSKEAPGRVLGLLTSELMKTGRFELVERSQIDRALREVALGQAGALDEKTAKEAGRLMGADAVLVGEITGFQHESTPMEYRYERERVQGIPLPPGDRTSNFLNVPAEKRTYTVEKYNASIGFSLRMISVATGEVVWSRSVTRSFGMREGEYEIRNVYALFDKLAEAAAQEAVHDFMP